MKSGRRNEPLFNEIQLIQREYAKINEDWLTLHFFISLGTVLFAFVVECATAFIFIRSDLLSSTVPVYLLKFVTVPGVINFICVIAGKLVIRSQKLSIVHKTYIISILYTLICFTLCTIHSVFVSTYYVFTGAVVLTTIYGSYRLTVITASLSLTLLVVSELFITWDPDKKTIFESSLRLGNFLVALCILLAFSAICMVVIQYTQKKSAASIQIEQDRLQLQQRLKLDELTGLLNRKALHDAMRDIGDYHPEDQFILAMIDLDNFKHINDHWGHQTGDQCLIAFAEALKEQCKQALAFRYGGDEFCLLFHNVTMEQAVASCGQAQEHIRRWSQDAGLAPEVTASFGLAAYGREVNAAQLFIYADQALYAAKESRASVRIYTGDDATL